jgi:hypothetical protein
LSGATVSVTSNYSFTGSPVTVKIYKNSVADSNLVWSGTQINSGNSITSQLFNLSQNNTVDAGSTNTYIIVLEWAIYDWSGTPDWNVYLNDLEIIRWSGYYKISNYQNLGELPISESR